MSNNKYLKNTLTEYEKECIKSCEFEISNIDLFLKGINLIKKAEEFKMFECSDGKTISLHSPLNSLITNIFHLPEDEQEKIFARHKIFTQFQTKGVTIRGQSYLENKNDVGKVELHIKLLTSKKIEIVELFGKMYTIEEVLMIIRNEWKNTTISRQILSNFYKDNLDEINRLKEKHQRDYSHLRLTTKTSRLEELTFLYGKSKSRYEMTNNREDHKVLVSTLESIRKEVEGDKLLIEGSIDLKVQQQVNETIKHQLLNGLTLKEIIIGRLSQRLNLPADRLINNLNKSYYAKLNRLINDADDVDYEELEKPSDFTYDFEKIKQVQQKEKEEEKKLLLVGNVVDDEEKKRRELVKQRLLEKLKGVQGG